MPGRAPIATDWCLTGFQGPNRFAGLFDMLPSGRLLAVVFDAAKIIGNANLV